jgi:subtilisin family serine protease
LDGTHGYDFVDGDTNPMDVDPSGTYHGTGVAGVIAAITDNGQGIAGTAQISVIALRALGSNGQGSSYNTSQAIRWAADHGAKVINLSLGTNETFIGPTDIQLAVNYAWSKGALIVAAAGNSGTSTLDYPARLANVVSVAAIDESGQRASFSNYGNGLDLSAPGTRIVTLNGGNNQPNNVHYLQGTSFSTPFVSGAAALLLSVDPSLTNVELWNILNSTAVQPSGAQRPYNPGYGWGVVNVWNAINALSQPFISVNSYPSSVSSSSTFGVTWSILGPTGIAVSDTHVLWGTVPGRLGNATAAQSGQTHDSFTANGFSMPSGAGALYFKVVATVNGTTYTSREYTVTASSLPDFLFVLYQLLASNLLYLALFILVLAGVVAFIPQRRAARARRAVARPLTLYPPSYYVQAARPSQPPPVAQPAQPATRIEPPMAGPPSTPTQIAPAAQPVTQIPMAQPTAAKKRCPSCGTMVAADNMFCFFCGNRFR